MERKLKWFRQVNLTDIYQSVLGKFRFSKMCSVKRAERNHIIFCCTLLYFNREIDSCINRV